MLLRTGPRTEAPLEVVCHLSHSLAPGLRRTVGCPYPLKEPRSQGSSISQLEGELNSQELPKPEVSKPIGYTALHYRQKKEAARFLASIRSQMYAWPGVGGEMISSLDGPEQMLFIYLVFS